MSELDAYEALAWRLFPVAARGKRPAFGDSWPVTATADPEQHGVWWRPGSRLNVGVVCGETFDVFDLEAEHLERFRAYMGERSLPETPVAQSGRGGLHLFVERTGINANRRLFIDGVHVGELKSRRGYVLVAPSVTDGPYRWLWPPETPLAEAPDWLLTMVDRPRAAPRRFLTSVHSAEEGRRSLDALAQAVSGAGEGHRNGYLYWAMRRALEEGIPPRYAGLALVRAGLDAGLGETETRRTIRSAYEAEGLVDA